VTARLRYLGQTAREMSCFEAPKQQRAALLPVYRDMFAEALRISTLPEHRRLAQRICHEIHWLTVSGSDPSPRPAEAQAREAAYLRTVAPECTLTPPDDSQRATMLRAIERGDRAALERGLAAGFDPNRPLNDIGQAAIAVAARSRRPELVAVLARSGARVDLVDAGNRSALDHALSPPGGPGRVDVSVVEALLEGGADPNRPDVFGRPPLIRAAESGDAKAFEVLVRHGADVRVRQACQRADPNCPGKQNTVLHVARDPGIAALAIERGADVNARGSGGNVPLAYAMTAEVAGLLIAKGADPNAANASGWTPVMYALQRFESYKSSQFEDRYRGVVVALVQSGARLDAKNDHGVDAFHYTKDAAFKARLRELAASRPK
jgi:ankyrin repeat protein